MHMLGVAESIAGVMCVVCRLVDSFEKPAKYKQLLC